MRSLARWERHGAGGARCPGFSVHYGWEPIPFRQVTSSSGEGVLPMGAVG